jgi:hypothetical protein
MSQDRNNEIDYERFAQYTVERWKERMKKARVGGSGELYRSFAHHVYLDANGDLQKVVYTFHFYGWYVDAGVGRGYFHGNGGDLPFLADKSVRHRRPKPWYNKIWYGQFRKLLHMLAEELGEKAVEEMMVFENNDFNITM